VKEAVRFIRGSLIRCQFMFYRNGGAPSCPQLGGWSACSRGCVLEGKCSHFHK
jgi:hypothetical protein